MLPIAVFRGTKDTEGGFTRLINPGKRRHRYRVVMWAVNEAGKKFTSDLNTDKPIRFNELVEPILKPELNELMDEAREGDTVVEEFGFEVYLWG